MILYNTLTKKKEEFIPLDENNVKMYVCGPTVYNFIHIGNARPLCVFDVLRRYLIFKGYNVTFVQNFTDIDDKIIKKANEEGVDFSTISSRYIDEFKKDVAGLNVVPADINPKATETINEMIEIISSLIEKDMAYVSNGDVYFSALKFPHYGELSGQPIDDLIEGGKLEPYYKNKKHPLDFALWKSAKPGEPFWISPWGKGRPGWHIECSAMIFKHLGKTIDIHCGGQDLIFPHHENEIAQSQCFTGRILSRFWLHNGFINVDNKKMSKSLNNFFTVRDISNRFGYMPIRYLMISSHYRSPLNFSEDSIVQSQNSLNRLSNFRRNLEFLKRSPSSSAPLCSNLDGFKNKFISFMDDDLNFSGALSVLFDMVKEINSKISNSQSFSHESIDQVIGIFENFTNIFGLKINLDIKIPDDIKLLVKERENARSLKNWDVSDRIRNQLKEKGYIVQDTKSGTNLFCC